MKRKGISLIILIITIVVIIILAAAVILTISKNNPVESAKKATFLNDLSVYQDELSLYIGNRYITEKGDFEISSIDDSALEEVVEVHKKYNGKFVIKNGKIVGTDKLSDQEKEWIKTEVVVVPKPDSGYGTNGNTSINVAKVNKPVLTQGLTAIKYDDAGIAIKTIAQDKDWYAYINQGEYLTDSKTSMWANAQSEDGSQ